MRLDARTSPESQLYRVYHAEECRMLDRVVWVDDETQQFGRWPERLVYGVEPIVRQARRIVIDVDRRFIVINPIEDADDVQTSNQQEVHA